ncbi:hypothetical protein MRX96_056640 [Rhipicephalus microplus]
MRRSSGHTTPTSPRVVRYCAGSPVSEQTTRTARVLTGEALRGLYLESLVPGPRLVNGAYVTGDLALAAGVGHVDFAEAGENYLLRNGRTLNYTATFQKACPSTEDYAQGTQNDETPHGDQAVNGRRMGKQRRRCVEFYARVYRSLEWRKGKREASLRYRTVCRRVTTQTTAAGFRQTTTWPSGLGSSSARLLPLQRKWGNMRHTGAFEKLRLRGWIARRPKLESNTDLLTSMLSAQFVTLLVG